MRKGLKLYYEVAGLRGVVAGVLGKLARRQTTMQVRLPDAAGVVRLRFPSTDVTTFRQVIVRGEYDLDVRRAPEVIIDAGANIGLASIYFACRYPDARILAIEPAKDNFALLERNVAAFPNVIPLRAALWGSDGQIDLRDPGLGESGYVTGPEASGVHRERVPAMSMDTILDRFGMDRVDLLKVDIEGAEREVFEHSASWIDKVDAIAIELHERIKAGCEQAFSSATQRFEQAWQHGENTFRARARARVQKPA